MKNYKKILRRNLVEEKLKQIIYLIIDSGIKGFGPFNATKKLSNDYLDKYNDVELAIDEMISNEIIKIGASGFLMGIPGFTSLPLTIPVNVYSDYFIAARLITAIAYLRGWDIEDYEVKKTILLCLIGNKGKNFLKKSLILTTIKTLKFFPFIGGVVNAGFDIVFIYLSAQAAKKYFFQKKVGNDDYDE